MKVKILTVLFLVSFNFVLGQWNDSGNNYTTGKLGIGTTSPSSPLHISSSTNRVLRLDKTNVPYGSYTWQSLETNSVEQWRIVGRESDNAGLEFWSKNSDRVLSLLQNGNVGVGTANPSSSLQVTGNIGGTNGRNFKVTYSNGGGLTNTEFSALTHLTHIPNINGWTALFAKQGSAEKAGVFDGDVFVNGNFHIAGDVGGTNGRNFKVTYPGGGGLTNTEFSALTHITHIPNVNGWTALYAKQGSAEKAGVFDGDVSVNGNIHTKEVKVDLNGWPDFVFEQDYDLPTLRQVEKHIEEKGHLKDIPSAKEVAENGIFLGEMDSRLLQKIEELTLYTIQQEKKIDKQAGEIVELKNLVKQLLESKQ